MADEMVVEDDAGSNSSQKQLVLYVERIERLMEDRKDINEDIRDVKTEAKCAGFDARTIMEVIKYRAMDRSVRQERKALLDTYLAAFGIDD